MKSIYEKASFLDEKTFKIKDIQNYNHNTSCWETFEGMPDSRKFVEILDKENRVTSDIIAKLGLNKDVKEQVFFRQGVQNKIPFKDIKGPIVLAQYTTEGMCGGILKRFVVGKGNRKNLMFNWDNTYTNMSETTKYIKDNMYGYSEVHNIFDVDYFNLKEYKLENFLSDLKIWVHFLSQMGIHFSNVEYVAKGGKKDTLLRENTYLFNRQLYHYKDGRHNEDIYGNNYYSLTERLPTLRTANHYILYSISGRDLEPKGGTPEITLLYHTLMRYFWSVEYREIAKNAIRLKVTNPEYSEIECLIRAHFTTDMYRTVPIMTYYISYYGFISTMFDWYNPNRGQSYLNLGTNPKSDLDNLTVRTKTIQPSMSNSFLYRTNCYDIPVGSATNMAMSTCKNPNYIAPSKLSSDDWKQLRVASFNGYDEYMSTIEKLSKNIKTK